MDKRRDEGEAETMNCSTPHLDRPELDPRRMATLPGFELPADWHDRQFRPPMMLPIPVALWADTFAPPFPVIVGAPDRHAFMPMWGLSAPDRGGQIKVASHAELNQLRYGGDRMRPGRAHLEPADRVWMLTVDDAAPAPAPIDHGPPTSPSPRQLVAATEHSGSLLGREGWCETPAGWEAVVAVSDLYLDVLPLANQAVLGLAEGDDTSALYVQVCDAGAEVGWSLTGEAPRTYAVLASAFWL